VAAATALYRKAPGLAPLNARRHQIARTPNYSFERQERERAKANKLAQKANEKREQRERERALSQGPADAAPAPDDD
jgi:hypothetical protein